LPVAEAAAVAIRTGLGYETVAVNLREGDDAHVVVVEGADEAREALLGTSNSWASWERLLDPAQERCGAIWLPAGSHDWAGDLQVWTPYTSRGLDADAWDGEDMLLLPLRGACGEVLGVISVDEPISGRRPADDELTILMAVADHAALALELAGEARSPAGELRLAAVMLLAETLDLRDAGTAAHSRTVGAFARETAATLGLEPARVERLHAAGVLHDLGKLGIADAILHKPGKLDDGEWREMRRHPEIGARILEHAGLDDIAAWVRAHHERLDGLGYPLGLDAAQIPLESRILAVADAYEAMIAERPYRCGLPAEAARAELLRGAATQFDPDVVEAFLRTLAAPPVPAA
jgi:HD-GYP domain-containing protein (c-di-GMP phosphodiesterase class II)